MSRIAVPADNQVNIKPPTQACSAAVTHRLIMDKSGRATSLIYVSGCNGAKSDGSFDTTLTRQATQALSNLKTILEAAGSGLDCALKCTVLLRDMNDFATFNAIYATFFTQSAPPARACFAVDKLSFDALVEIECYAIERPLSDSNTSSSSTPPSPTSAATSIASLTVSTSPKPSTAPLPIISVSTDEAPAAIGPYSQAIVHTQAGIIFVSGCIALPSKRELPLLKMNSQSSTTTNGNEMTLSLIHDLPILPNGLLGATAEDQCVIALRNLEAILHHAGSDISKVLKVNILLAKAEDYTAVVHTYHSLIYERPPAQTCYVVKELPKGALVEIECVAVVDDAQRAYNNSISGTIQAQANRLSNGSSNGHSLTTDNEAMQTALNAAVAITPTVYPSAIQSITSPFAPPASGPYSHATAAFASGSLVTLTMHKKPEDTNSSVALAGGADGHASDSHSPANFKPSGTVFVSGCASLNVTTGAVEGKSLDEQINGCFSNLERILRTAGSSVSKTLKFTVMLDKSADLSRFDEAFTNAWKKFSAHDPTVPPVSPNNVTTGLTQIVTPRGSRSEDIGFTNGSNVSSSSSSNNNSSSSSSSSIGGTPVLPEPCPPPAITTIVVSALTKKHAMVEVDCIAAL